MREIAKGIKRVGYREEIVGQNRINMSKDKHTQLPTIDEVQEIISKKKYSL